MPVFKKFWVTWIIFVTVDLGAEIKFLAWGRHKSKIHNAKKPTIFECNFEFFKFEQVSTV
jgi:hypothetical protein